jgi:transposase
VSKETHKRQSEMPPVLHPDAAGVDIGTEEVFVAVSSDRDAEPVRKFSTFTRDLLGLAEWLKR